MSRTQFLPFVALFVLIHADLAQAQPKPSDDTPKCEPMPDCQVLSENQKPGMQMDMMKKGSSTKKSSIYRGKKAKM